MKIKSFTTVVAFMLVCAHQLTMAQSIAPNPFVTSIYTADPSAHVWADGRLYVYPSHDIAPPRGCDLMDQYHVYSTDDMVHWTDHGEILRAAQVPWGRSEGGFMWAPDCAYKNGTYYFYFPHPSGNGDAWNSTWKIGVATSQSPASGFTVQGYIPGLESLIDPCVFTDDDGQTYFYYGGGNVCKGGRLKANMMEIDGSLQAMQGLDDFHEATWIHKRNGLYYLSYADNNNEGGNRLRYAVSTSPLGPWTSKGVYLDPTGSPTSHGAIVQYKGQWYAFYHNSELSNNPWLRSICVDKLLYNADGTIQKVATTKAHGTPYGGTARTLPGTIEAEDYNLGGPAAGYRDNDPENVGGQYRVSEGVDVENCSAGGYSIGFTNDGEYTNYTVNVATAGTYTIRCLAASGSDTGGAFHIEADDVDVTGTIRFANTGGWQNWTSINAGSVTLTAGTHVIRFYTQGGMNFDKMIFGGDNPLPSPYYGTPLPVPGTVQAEDYDRGGEGVAYHDASTQNEGGQYRAEGVDVETCSAGGYNIGFTAGGEWSAYTVHVQRNSSFDINCFVASGIAGGGAFYLAVDGKDVTGTLSIPNNGWQAWVVHTASNIALTAGTHIVKFYTSGGMNFDKMVFVERTGKQGVFSIFPNPSKGVFTVAEFPATGVLTVTNNFGRTVYQQDLTRFAGTIDISTQPVGLYVVTVISNGQRYTTQLSKQ